MDFAAIGESMAMAQAIRNARQAAQAADDEVVKANGIIARKNREIDELRRQLAETNKSYLIQIAHTEGVLMQARELRAALTEVSPGHRLLKPTGKRFEDGTPECATSLTFQAHFDLKAAEVGLPPPYQSYRITAK